MLKEGFASAVCSRISIRTAAGSIASIEAATDPAIKRIYLIDAPSVLGWAHWRAVDAGLGMASLRAGVDAVLAERRNKKSDAQALTHLLSGEIERIGVMGIRGQG